MAGKMIKRTKLAGLGAVATQLFLDLKEVGLTQVMPATGQNFTLTSGAGKFVMDSSLTVNPKHVTQPWRMLVDVSGATGGAGQIKIAIANPEQISNAGATSSFPGGVDVSGARVMGQLGNAWTAPSSALGSVFVNRQIANQTFDAGTTISYVLTATARGIAFFIWDEGSDASPKFSWFLVQSAVNKDTGAARVDNLSPIFCVYSCDAQQPQKFVISESDIFRPTLSKPADEDDIDSAAILNSKQQVAIAIGNKYLVTFPNRLNTDRYAYTDELDMIAYTSADVISEDSEIPVRPYGETADRVYRAFKANGANNTGMRLLLLVEGGGIDAV